MVKIRGADGAVVDTERRLFSKTSYLVFDQAEHLRIRANSKGAQRFFPLRTSTRADKPCPPMTRLAVLSLGANLGQRGACIRSGLRGLGKKLGRVVSTSLLYETAPALVEDQPQFLNAACCVAISNDDLSPLDCLALIKDIEREHGRVEGSGVRYGPRPLDIDILLLDGEVVLEGEDTMRTSGSSRHLDIPHPGLPSRDFVLRPVCDMVPDAVHPTLGRTMRDLLNELQAGVAPDAAPTMAQVSHLPHLSGLTSEEETILRWDRAKTLVMAILNVTPDSFSDGGQFGLSEGGDEAARVERAVERVRELLGEGADVIDIGGESTRPGAERVSAATETARVVPVVEAIRREFGGRVLMSVDTTRAEVAREAVAAGAHMVNDVSGGAFDAAMLTTVAALGVPYMSMHIRGNPQTMQDLATYDDLVAEIRAELGLRVQEAFDAGIPRWDVIVDPGIGFAKTADQNLQILRDLPDIFPGAAAAAGSSAQHQRTAAKVESAAEEDLCAGLPVLVGASRKGFVGQVTGRKDATERTWGTAATSVAAILGGASMVRVHDVAGQIDAIRMADAIRVGEVPAL